MVAAKMEHYQFMKIAGDVDVTWCSHEAMRFAKNMGFDDNAVWSIGIAVSELVSNVLKFAGHGGLTVRRILTPKIGLELVVEDDGPGIDDPQAAVVDGYSEGMYLSDQDPVVPRRGLGSGLGAARRLLAEIIIELRPQGGTKIVGHKWLNNDNPFS
ncbi:MAG: ATP-binding protein [Deltaproteobacteria bacterium]|nr:ATP-binding protein [Deltaproteobacteria bacterium]